MSIRNWFASFALFEGRRLKAFLFTQRQLPRSIYTLIAVFSGITAATFLQNWTAHLLLEPVYIQLFMLMLMTIALLLFSEIRHGIRQLRDKTDFSIDIYPVEEPHRRAELFRRSEAIVKRAEVEIIALNSFSEERFYNEDKDHDSRKSYFEALNQAIDRGIKYHRIVQTDEALNIQKHFDEYYKDHFQKIVEVREKRSRDYGRNMGAVLLDWVAPSYPTTFLIVDNHYLIWQLNELDARRRHDGVSKRDRVQMRAVIIVHDAAGKFIEDFRYIWSRCLQHSEKTSVTEEHIRGRESTRGSPCLQNDHGREAAPTRATSDLPRHSAAMTDAGASGAGAS